jgi:hypothetical protein
MFLRWTREGKKEARYILLRAMNLMQGEVTDSLTAIGVSARGVRT